MKGGPYRDRATGTVAHQDPVITFAANHAEGLMTLEVGDKIRRCGPLGLWHYGIFVGAQGPNGEDVVHNSKERGVVLVHFHSFAGGKECFIERRAATGFGEVVAQRALNLRGTHFDLLSFNCEHFANVAQVGERSSGQLQGAGIVAGLIAILALGLNSGGVTYDRRAGRYRGSDGRFTRG